MTANISTATTDTTVQLAALRSRYIDLLRDALTMSLWHAADGNQMQNVFGASASELREDGRDWPQLAHTMIGRKRMNNLQFCVEDVLSRGIPGDFIETGVWRGGACIFMRGILEAYGITDRKVWVADSFQGLPPADVDKYPIDGEGVPFHIFPQLAISQETVENNFRSYGLLDDQVVMLKGFFRDSLPTAPVGQLAILRLDGDMYESTIDALNSLYSKLSDGGYVIVDDFCIEGCRQAIHDFRTEHGITDVMHVVDWTGVYWRKGSGDAGNGAPTSFEELSATYDQLFSAYVELRNQHLAGVSTIAQLRVDNATANAALAASGAQVVVPQPPSTLPGLAKAEVRRAARKARDIVRKLR
ncbi:TylF/MycF family methyltransferase [Smaragdicoccus niigatensis]|uniref:TylF/MycF family methyltransferase n=1 Tax=Smaragdicoccus niigatensis TaxID=359359 RepID=UPI00037ABFAD|nr:TylF/MycF family methyltransferase [Smaragdicoccus niigatensis]